MFTLQELNKIWLVALDKAKKCERKTFGANEAEQNSMQYMMDKQEAIEWRKIQEKAGLMFRELVEANKLNNGD